jgi:arylsulfatase A-like enzyme
MNRHLKTLLRPMLVRLLLSFVPFVLLAEMCVASDRPPNIVFAFADDLGYGDLGCYGHPYAKTPALDRLAKEGTRFTQFYVTGVTCNPSRTGLMTGLFPARFPKYAADFGFEGRVTITELLKKRGYKTGHFGKWHIGPESEDGTYGIDTVKVIGKSGDVYQIDLNVGRLLEAIDELGLRDNTIVVFSSDHGPAPVIPASKGVREFSMNMLGYAAEFRGGRHTQFEGGTRVPLIIRWPGHVKAGRVDRENVTSFIDWMPTLCAIAGVDAPPEQLDGEDVSDIWIGADRERSKPLFWKSSAVGGTPAMRDGKWKLHLPRRQRGEVELYDLSADPSESNNVAEQHLDVVARLARKVRTRVAELPDQYEKRDKISRNQEE